MGGFNMKGKLGIILGVIAGIIGLGIGGLALAGGAALEMEVETFLFGYLSAGILGMMVLILSGMILAGSLIAVKAPGNALWLIFAPSLAGLILLGVVFALPAVLGLAASALLFFNQRKEVESIDESFDG